MANDLNRCEFIGRLGQDPDLRYLQNGTALAKISIAVGKVYKDKNTGEKMESTTWVPITFFGRLAEVVGEYLKKGSKVFVAGEYHTSKYEKNGETRYSTDVIGNQMQMLDSKGSGQSQGNYGAGTYGDNLPSHSGDPNKTTTAQNQDGTGFDFDDDIPFDLFARVGWRCM